MRAVCACTRRPGSLRAMKWLACRLKRVVDPECEGVTRGIVAVIGLSRAAAAHDSAKNESSRRAAYANAPIVPGSRPAPAAVGVKWNEQARVAFNREVMPCRNLRIQLSVGGRAASQIMRRKIDARGQDLPRKACVDFGVGQAGAEARITGVASVHDTEVGCEAPSYRGGVTAVQVEPKWMESIARTLDQGPGGVGIISVGTIVGDFQCADRMAVAQ